MCHVTATALAVSAGMSGIAATVAGYAVSGALIGIATNAVVNVATGRGAFEGVGKAALFGGIAGGFGGAAGFTGPVSSGWETVRNIGGTLGQSGIGIAATTAIGSYAAGMMPSNVGYTPAAQVSQQQQIRALNMNTNIATTGSGGRQAATSLAAAISRTKKRKLTQRDVGDLSLDTSSYTNTGLQLA